MPIHNIVVHKLQKDRQTESVLALAESVLPNDSSADTLMQQIKKIYNGKSSKAWGVFQDNQTTYPFSRLLQSYLSDDDFLEFSLQSMHLLKSKIDNQRLATGGYLLFVHYDDYLMIVMLDDVDGTMITDDLQIQETTHLDMSKLHLAARVGIETWEADEDRKYLSLIKGTNKRDYALYFQDFIGCDEFSEPKEQTRTLIRIVNDYCHEHELDSHETKRVKKGVFDFCDTKRKAKEAVELSELANAVFSSEPEVFLEHCRRDEYTLSDSFELDNKELKRLTYISVKGTGFSLSFNVELLGETVHYDQETKSLQFESLPDDVINNIESIENGRE